MRGVVCEGGGCWGDGHLVLLSELEWGWEHRFEISSVYNTHMDSREVMRRLERDGWNLRNVRGSHHNFTHPSKRGLVTVKHPSKDLPIGTLRNIFRQAGWNWRNR